MRPQSVNVVGFFYLHVYNCSVTGTSKRKELPVTLLVEPSVLLHVTNYLSYNENTFDYANYRQHCVHKTLDEDKQNTQTQHKKIKRRATGTPPKILLICLLEHLSYIFILFLARITNEQKY